MMIRVAALVDLYRTPQAGGHVKCWERLAAAALGFADELDLTVHFLGKEETSEALGQNVRFRLHPPAFGTERLGFLAKVPDHTDLACFHPALARDLTGIDLIHTTSAHFSFARTAERMGLPMVNSIHTDTPGYGRAFGATIIGPLGRALRLDVGIEAWMRRRLLAHQARCRHVLVSRAEDAARAEKLLSADRVSFLRRGIDKALFDPARRDREWLAEAYGIPADRPVVAFAGRLNHGKGVMLLARTVAAVPGLHLFCAGEGEDRAAILALLGDRATCPGVLSPGELARVYASADIFASPSLFEVHGNVVQEALASGLPVLVAEESGMGRIVTAGETGFLLPGTEADAWAESLRDLAQGPDRRIAMGRAARAYAETALPGWDDVLAEDLLPVWRRVAGEAAQ